MASNDKQNKSGLRLADETTKPKPQKSRLVVVGSTIILVIIAITFIGAPTLRGFASSPSRIVFGSYDGKLIQYLPDNFFARQRDIIAENARETMNLNSSDDSRLNDLTYYFQISQIWRQAFESTAIHMALLSMAEKAGVHVTETKIDKAVIDSRYYVGSDGQFSEDTYIGTSAATRKANRDYIAEGVIQQEVVNDLFASRISTAEKTFVGGMASPEKKLRYVAFPYTDYPADQIADFATANAGLFRKIGLSRILVTESEAAILDIQSQLAANPDLFSELARNNSQDSFASKGGSMGTYSYFDLRGFFDRTEDLDRVMDLAKGEVSDVVVNEDGWYLYRCDVPAVAPDLSDPAERETVRAYIQRFEKGRMEDFFVARGAEFRTLASGEGSSLSSAAASAGFGYHETEFFPVIYGNIGFSMYGTTFPVFTALTVPDGDTTLQYTSTDTHFLETVAAMTRTGEISEPVILEDAVVVLELADQKELSEEERQTAEMYFSYGMNTWKENELSRSILESDKLVDNFNKEFGKNFSVQ